MDGEKCTMLRVFLKSKNVLISDRAGFKRKLLVIKKDFM